MQRNKKQIILFLSWRDLNHPQSGGAEVFTSEMLHRSQSRHEHQIIHFSTQGNQKTKISKKDNILYINKGNWFSVIIHAILFYRIRRKRIKFVVDQCNTHRFFTPFWVPRSKRIFFIHQLTKEIWRIKLPFILGFFGEILENLMLQIYKNGHTLTVSDSTRSDLIDLGFMPDRVHIMPEGIDHEPIPFPLKPKENRNLLLYVGRYSEYKGLPDATKAFINYLKINPNAQFVLVGKKNEDYIQSVLKPICDSHGISLASKFSPNNKNTITLLGRVSEKVKLKFMKEASILVYPSRREGWGLGVTEAAVLGTPSIVYNSPGLIDAVNKGNAGFLCSTNSPAGILQALEKLTEDRTLYEKIRVQAYNYSKQFKWDNTAKAFDQFIQEEVYV